MYSVYVDGIFNGHAQSINDAIGIAIKWGGNFGKSWEILSSFNEVVARG